MRPHHAHQVARRSGQTRLLGLPMQELNLAGDTSDQTPLDRPRARAQTCSDLWRSCSFTGKLAGAAKSSAVLQEVLQEVLEEPRRLQHTHWLVGGADRGNTTSSSSHSVPSCMSLSSTVPGGGGGGGGSGGNTVGPSGPVDVGEIRLAGPSEVGEQRAALPVPELVPWRSVCPPAAPPLPAPLMSSPDRGYGRLMSRKESGEVFGCWRPGGAAPGPVSGTRALPGLG